VGRRVTRGRLRRLSRKLTGPPRPLTTTDLVLAAQDAAPGEWERLADALERPENRAVRDLILRGAARGFEAPRTPLTEGREADAEV